MNILDYIKEVGLSNTLALLLFLFFLTLLDKLVKVEIEERKKFYKAVEESLAQVKESLKRVSGYEEAQIKILKELCKKLKITIVEVSK